jgi:hypothetical protein
MPADDFHSSIKLGLASILILVFIFSIGCLRGTCRQFTGSAQQYCDFPPPQRWARRSLDGHSFCIFRLRWGFCFSIPQGSGRVPLSASIFVVDHLRPAGKKAGVKIKVEPKIAQGILRQTKIQTTLDL